MRRLLGGMGVIEVVRRGGDEEVVKEGAGWEHAVGVGDVI